MPKPTTTALAVCALLTVAIATAALYAPCGATPDQADTVRISATAANTGGIYFVTNAITGDDYDVVIPRPPQPAANTAL